MRCAPLACMLPLVSLASACAGAPEEMDRPDDQSISSRVSRGSDGELLVAVTHSGGGAGDSVHRLLACPALANTCELLASVDANDGPLPALVEEGSRIAFTINESDYLSGFRNFSREVPSLRPGSIAIRYRGAPPRE